MKSDLEFADFLDNSVRAHAMDAEYRARLESEHPARNSKRVEVCPASHRHEETGTCYQHHKCRCTACKRGQAVRQQDARTRAAIIAARTKAKAA